MRLWAIPSWRQNSAMLSSPRRFSRTMLILFSAEKCRPVALRMSLTAIIPEKVERLAASGATAGCARLALREVSVKDKEIRITGSKAVLARAAAQGLGETPPGVLSFVREWRPRQDSNLRPAA
jgi:hypothetical protein